MRTGFYPKIAWTGMKKNKKFYLPYIFAGVGMIIMFYSILFLTQNETVRVMEGGATMQAILGMGTMVIGVFSLIFLFYTNSFLMRRRSREFGLYHVLGMGKTNVARILIWEALLTAVISLASGLVCGILFSKAGELIMVNILKGEAAFSFNISGKSVLMTLKVFGFVFLLILVKNLIEIYRLNPMELLHSDVVGERPPKANWMAGILGMVILITAYYLATSIEEPMNAITSFFVAVVLVIIATYLLFCAGSVVLCRFLAKNKTYYYKTSHFISVSSMMYRMKRNGAVLASICILSTMVLVMVSSVSCLYFGAEDSLNRRYPRDLVVDTYSGEPDVRAQVQDMISNVLENHQVQKKNVLNYQFLDAAGHFKENKMYLDTANARNVTYSDIRQLFVIPVKDYNRIMGKEETLKKDEILVFSTKSEYNYDTIELESKEIWRVKKTVPEFVDNGVDAMQIIPSTFIFVRDMGIVQDLEKQWRQASGQEWVKIHSYYGTDLDCDEEEQIQITKEIQEGLIELSNRNSGFPEITLESRAAGRHDFYALYGGMFFLGILLGIVFILGTVLIMYYKQVTEGYEDQSRFEILQKVGMTRREVKKSINSQVRTVFFLPLLAAGVHTGFAFPLIRKILMLFSVTNRKLLLGVMGSCYLLFAVFYVTMYIITSRAYYGIVSKKEEK